MDNLEPKLGINMQYYTHSTNKLEFLLLLTNTPHRSFLALGNYDPHDKRLLFLFC